MLVIARPITFKLSRLISVTVSMKCIFRNLEIGDLRSGQSCDLSIIPKSQWENNERRLFWTKTIWNTQATGYRYTWHPESEYCDQWPIVMSPRSFQVMKGHQQFSAIYFDGDQLEWWKHHKCVEADDTDRLICNMTFSDQVMSLILRQILKLTF